MLPQSPPWMAVFLISVFMRRIGGIKAHRILRSLVLSWRHALLRHIGLARILSTIWSTTGHAYVNRVMYLFDTFWKTKIWKRWHDQMESRLILVALGQQRDQLDGFQETSWPYPNISSIHCTQTQDNERQRINEYIQPWTKSKGIALGLSLRWCKKWTSSSPNPSTGTGTVNCASCSFSCFSFSRQLKSFFQAVVSRFTSSRGAPMSHSALSSSSGKVARVSFSRRVWSWESGTLIVKGWIDIFVYCLLHECSWLDGCVFCLVSNMSVSDLSPHVEIYIRGCLGLCVYILVRIQSSCPQSNSTAIIISFCTTSSVQQLISFSFLFFSSSKLY